jgi:peptidyl-prolyl cis-trans isomerase D
MLSMFRNFTKSRVGMIVVFLVLGVIAIAFAVTSGTGVESMTGAKGKVVAKVGDHEITETDLNEEIARVLKARRAQGQNISMEAFLAAGGLEGTLDRLVNVAAIEEFARVSGMRVDKQMIESEIVNNPAFQGFDGKFSQVKFDTLLAENRISTATFRESLASERYINWLLAGTDGSLQLPDGVLAPYAALRLERRQGVEAIIRITDVDAVALPDEKTLTAFYTRNRSRYLIPQRRVIRYALVQSAQLKAASAPTEAEIAAAFAKAGPRYAATEKRTVRQLVVIDQAAANAAAAEVKAGKPIADVARARGLEARTFETVEKAALARDTSPQVADAAFAAAQGAVVGPVRAKIGWAVLHIDSVQKIPARTLAQVRAEVADEVSQRKVAATLASLRQSLEDNIGNGATFDEAVAQAKLSAQRTPALVANGIDPDNPAAKLDPALAPVVQAGFAADPSDQEPLVVALGQDGSFAIVTVERVVAAAAPPLAKIQKQVQADYGSDQAMQKARKVAADVVAQLNRGVPMAQALASVGRPLLPPKPFDIKRAEMKRTDPPRFQMALAMAPKTAKLIEAPGRAGYHIVYLTSIEQHDASGNRQLLDLEQQQRGPIARQEIAEQFVEGMKRHVKVTRNGEAIAELRAQLARQGAR